LQFLTYVILVYVLVEKSPKEMGTYRWWVVFYLFCWILIVIWVENLASEKNLQNLHK
jgi:hypothetical protein